MSYNVIISPVASEELDEIIGYIKYRLFNHKAARKFHEDVCSCFLLLNNNPEMYPLHTDPKFKKLNYRKAIVGKYIILYVVDDLMKEVHIQHVTYGRRDYRDLR